MMLFLFLFSVFFCSGVRSFQEENSRWMDSDSLVRRRYWSPLEGRMYGERDYDTALIKKNFDEIDNVGFNDLGNGGRAWYRKRNLLVPQIRRLVKRYLSNSLVRKSGGHGEFDQIDRVGFNDFGKRNFDEIDRAGFGNLAKRNFDEIDRAGFRDLVRREASPVGNQQAASKQ